jgi:hypothetical protein
MRRQANDLAHREGISLNHFISLAIAEKVTRMEQSMRITETTRFKEESGVAVRSTLERRI